MDTIKNNVFIGLTTHIEKEPKLQSSDEDRWLHIGGFSILFKVEWLRANANTMRELAEYILSVTRK